MERKTKKVKKEGDTCRDCWTKRFREDIHAQWESEKGNITLAAFLNRELESRELDIKNMREEFGNVYDEISSNEHLAGDVYMGRFDKEDKGD